MTWSAGERRQYVLCLMRLLQRWKQTHVQVMTSVSQELTNMSKHTKENASALVRQFNFVVVQQQLRFVYHHLDQNDQVGASSDY